MKPCHVCFKFPEARILLLESDAKLGPVQPGVGEPRAGFEFHISPSFGIDLLEKHAFLYFSFKYDSG